MAEAGLLSGKRALILGVANDHSIAWGIAQAMAAHGAELAFTYQGEGFGRRVAPLAESLGARIIEPADVQDAASLDALFARLEASWGRLDILVHAIAYSDKAELGGRFVETSRENFLNSLDISCYSLVDLSRRAMPLMTAGGTILTLTYLGAQRVTPHYNVMGVAKAALEASVRYLAADLGKDNIRVNVLAPALVETPMSQRASQDDVIMNFVKTKQPLDGGRNGQPTDLDGAAVYFMSDYSKFTTGQVLAVDGGWSVTEGQY